MNIPVKSIIILILIMLSACVQPNKLWPSHDSQFITTSYKLNIEDTILYTTKNSRTLQINKPHDSLIIKHDTITYQKPCNKARSVFSAHQLHSTKIRQSNPLVHEFYSLNNGAIHLVGYASGDSLNTYVAFSEPLVILPSITQGSCFTQGYQQNWNPKQQIFIDDTKIHSEVKLIQTGIMLIDGQKEEVMLYEISLGGDTKIAYGNQELIMPDAFLIRSKLLYGKTKGLLYEWSIQTTMADNKDDIAAHKTQQYIELTYYK